ncbi:hypothetical protein BC936DRAFT_137120 [Jimgerdemannia flammicorona]|uniref:Uncharacterized protein n=2 Tax=Jimgerdemannia flammicorona TaxID=994334 RepID=A0A433DJD9_9FUNG|nr:hypothetical protein BC936DRAFT_137120 [Jimgerdemannia flammicorona]RUS31317.1 hypothetical protein BC938DRAFT_478063 [Jimgerdemannia flammicorona]
MHAKDIFAITASGYLSVLAVPRAFFPELTLATWGPDARAHSQTQTEEILERSLAVAELALAALLIINCGTLPITRARERPATRHATILCGALYFGVCAYLSYESSLVPPLGGSGRQFVFSAFLQSLVAAFGLWCVLFGTDAQEIRGTMDRESKKHVSGFPFMNEEADRIKAERKEE